MLVGDILCRQCFGDKVTEELKEMQKRGEYHPDEVQKAGKAKDGSGSVLGESSQSAATTLDSKSAKVTITDKHFPSVTAEMITAEELEAKEKVDSDGGRGNKDKNSSPKIRTIKPAQTIRTGTYEGPVVKVFPEVDWQNPERGPYCHHIQKSMGCEKVALTAKVNVAAKLSVQYDGHLAREAKNYQSFPSHLFEHWNGYNIIDPLHDPVPVGAVVPQFYGYYVPEEKKGGKASRYLSPILLLENCGVPIDPESLNKDDKQECMSLLFRLNAAGWCHGSYAERNLLMQPGPLSQWPLSRGLDDVQSFRLIDFGRSIKRAKSSAWIEEQIADKMFRLLYH
jgi:hypothetical protein